MRVLQIVPSISLVYGGPSQMALGLSAALADEGVDVTMLTTDSNGDFGQEPLDVPLDRPVEQDGYQVRYFRCSPFRRYKFSWPLLQWLKQHANQFDIAHIHALFSPVSTAAAGVARSQNLPYLLRPLGTLDPADLRKKKYFKYLYAGLWERANISGAAAIHFTSLQEAKISRRFGARTQDLVIPLGVSLPEIQGTEAADVGQVRAKFGLPEGVPLLLFMSRIDPKKGLDLLIPALEALQQDGTDFHFVLAGANPQDPVYEQRIRDRIQASPIAPCTTLTGFVSGPMKTALLKEADLFVLPSYYENFGIAVAEAMAAGTPTIISNQVYIWEDVQHAEAGWVCYCQVDSLVSVLRTALQNPQERQHRGTQAQNYALSHYSWPAIAKRTVQAYQDILNRQSGST